jgi:hypothetical protein
MLVELNVEVLVAAVGAKDSPITGPQGPFSLGQRMLGSGKSDHVTNSTSLTQELMFAS